MGLLVEVSMACHSNTEHNKTQTTPAIAGLALIEQYKGLPALSFLA